VNGLSAHLPDHVQLVLEDVGIVNEASALVQGENVHAVEDDGGTSRLVSLDIVEVLAQGAVKGPANSEGILILEPVSHGKVGLIPTHADQGDIITDLGAVGRVERHAGVAKEVTIRLEDCVGRQDGLGNFQISAKVGCVILDKLRLVLLGRRLVEGAALSPVLSSDMRRTGCRHSGNTSNEKSRSCPLEDGGQLHGE
jgi:hypothetical protein